MTVFSRALFPSPLDARASIGLLVLRIVFGVAMTLHGLDKMREPLVWMGEDSWAPGWLQLLAAVSECFGGLAILFGILTPLAALGVAATMAVAMVTAHIVPGDPFLRLYAPEVEEARVLLGLPRWLVVRGGSGGSWEKAGVYFGIAVLFIGAGPGRYSIDAAIRRRLKR